MIARNKKYLPLVVHGLFAAFCWAVAVGSGIVAKLIHVELFALVCVVFTIVAFSLTVFLCDAVWTTLNKWCEEDSSDG